MCNFVPRECVAFGHLEDMRRRVSDWLIPGDVQSVPLLHERDYEDPRPFADYGFLHVTNIPNGLEVLAVSKLSAALSDLIGRHEAVVELNYYVPLAAAEPNGREPFSPVAQRVINQLKSFMTAATSLQRSIAVLDSGVDRDSLRLHEANLPGQGNRSTRRLVTIDYTNEGTAGVVDWRQIKDTLGHGSVVCRILDALLPYNVPLVVGRVARRREDVTSLYLARCYADIVAAEVPTIVNLSLAPLRDYLVCPHCGGDVPVDGFHTLVLPRVFRLAAGTTWTVMAAGNKGRACNADHFLADNEKLVYATATDSSNRPASYSNYIEGELARSVSAFGGDPAQIENGQGVLTGARRVAGTSFAAPFVSAALWAAIQEARPAPAIVDHCRSILAKAH